jgi:hypothetical protein
VRRLADLVKGWKRVVIPEEIYQRMKVYYEENEDDLKLTEGVRSLTGFINYCLRKQLKEITE